MTDAVTGQTNPGTLGTEYNVIAFVVAQLLQKVQTLTLVQVLSCTNDGGLSPVGRVSVQPLIFQMSGSRQGIAHGEISDLPYLRIQGGTDAVILDPKPGDIGMAAFCSRDISNVKADPQAAVSAGGVPPGSLGVFDWADGLYLGGFLNGQPVQYIRFSATGIEIVSPTKITLTAPTVEIDASTAFNVNTATADVQAAGTATISGASIVLAGPISQTGAGASSFSGSLAVQGTDVHTHGHNPGTLVAGSTPVTGLAGTPT
jgi:hypothetical protein